MGKENAEKRKINKKRLYMISNKTKDLKEYV